MTSRQTHTTISGISSALDVPVMHGRKEGESALFQGVEWESSTLVPMDGAAFCSREEHATVVIRVTASRTGKEGEREA
jgi:hypothetical protein